MGPALMVEAVEPRLLLAGTPQLIEINPFGSSYPSDFTQVGNVTFFVADDGASGSELWVTDGTVGGTSLVRDINEGAPGSYPRELVDFGGTLFFVADDGINGQELWKSDGTVGGTVMVRDINPGQGYQYPYGSGPLQSLPRDPTEANGSLFFSAEDATAGKELWRTDGTQSGTFLVRDINTSTYDDGYMAYPDSSNPTDFVEFNGELFFSADDGITGRELWKSDGTAAGTVLVKDIFPGAYDDYGYGPYPYDSQPSQLTVAGGELFFVAQDPAAGVELWKTDGTSAGTVLVRDINPTGNALNGQDSLVESNGTLYFKADDGTTGLELWKSDGTAEGTALVRDINSGGADGLQIDGDIVDVDGTVYFAANDSSNGIELWQSDPANGTQLVSNIASGAASSNPLDLTAVAGRLFFTAETATTGREIWEASLFGTTLAADLSPGASSSFPTELFGFDNLVLFAADDDIAGQELWVMDSGDATARVTIYVDSQQVPIPVDLGVDEFGNPSSLVQTIDENGTLVRVPIPGTTEVPLTLDIFFETWRSAAGIPGNNPAATFSRNELLENVADATSTVQMFVNGQLSTEFEDYAIQNGDEIVLVYGSHPVVSLNTNFGPIVVELFETATPGTVDNFLDYVNDGDYLSSFFHRSAQSPSVIQGGGFKTTSTTFTSTSQFSPVPTDPPIQNEPGISNLRGTVAMAKTNDPDSATSQFYVNVNANTGLDSPLLSGGFTVFAQVLDMASVDTIAALPINRSNAAPFGELPVSGNDQLAVIQSVEGNGHLPGVKFSDDNANGVRDEGEAGVADVLVYVDANANGTFDADEISTTTDADGRFLLQVEPGTYTVQAEVTAGKISTAPMGGRTVTVEIGREASGLAFGESPLEPPAEIDLLPQADTGSADDDDLTRFDNSSIDNVLQFQVSGVVDGAEVKIFSDGVLIGSGIAVGNSATVSTDGVIGLSDGQREITATQFVNGGESDASAALAITVDSTPPAAIIDAAPDLAQAQQPYAFDADSPDEGEAGLRYTLSAAPIGMTIDEQTGEINWTPAEDQAVPQSFAIVVTDAAGNSSSQNVEITVLGVIPAFPNEYSTNEDTTLIVDVANGVLADDGDENSGALSAVVVDQPTNGMLVEFNADGSFSYTPDSDFFGTDSFTYRASDEDDDSNVARVTITVIPVNDPVVPLGESYTATEDMVLVIDVVAGVLANDFDPEGDALSATVAVEPTNGTLELADDGSFRFTPVLNFSGSDSFTYRASDGLTTSDPVTVTLTVTAVNDPPTTLTDSYSVNEDGSLSIVASEGVLANDSDPDSTFTALVDGEPTNGTLTLALDGSFTYVPFANFFGTDNFTYVASDGLSQSSATSVTINVIAQPDQPTAMDNAFTAPNDGSTQTFDVLSDDTSDPDAVQALSITAVTQGSEGGVVSFTNNLLSYTAPLGFVGTETFTYSIQDTDGLTDTATVTVAVSESASSSLSGYVYVDTNGDGIRGAEEFGVPGTQVTLTGTENSGATVSRTFITTNTGFYTFEELASGTYQLTQTHPEAMFDGLDTTDIANALAGDDLFSNIVLAGGQDLDEINFGEAALRPDYVSIRWFFASATANDEIFREMIAVGEENAGRMELAAAIRAGTTDGVNMPPTAIADRYDASFETPLTVTAANGVLANDNDLDADNLTATLVASTTNGSLSSGVDGSFTYTPAAGFTGTDSFTYTASDGFSTSNVATVTIVVTAPADNTFSVEENSLQGTFVGTVTPEPALGEEVVFEFDDPVIAEELQLVPDDHFSGDPAAPLVLIEYLDLQCPSCQQFHPIVADLEDNFDGDLLVVRRHLPLTSIHFNAFAAAQSAEAAGRQGLFEEMADLMFANQRDWEFVDDPQPFFDDYADQLGLDMVQFATDREDPEISSRIQRDIDSANALGAAATPTFYLNGQLLDLNDALDDFDGLIGDALDDFDDPFLIDRSTGEIIVSGSVGLNFESSPAITRSVRVTDLAGITDLVDVTINLVNVNDSTPLAVSDTYDVDEGDVLSKSSIDGVLANDTDADGDLLTANLVSGALNGLAELELDGSFTYTPDAGFNGTDSFSYRATDGTFTSSTVTVTITVAEVNVAPVAQPDSYSVAENELLTISAGDGVLSNDSDADGDTLTAIRVSDVMNGGLVLESDGSFTYGANTGFSGTDSFTYRANDGLESSLVTTVTIVVNPAAAAPCRAAVRGRSSC